MPGRCNFLAMESNDRSAAVESRAADFCTPSLMTLLKCSPLGSAFSAFEQQVMTASQACVRAVLKAGIESLDDGARHVFRGGRRHRRVPATPRRVMTSAGPVEYSRPRYRSESGDAIMPVDEQVCFAGGYFTERAAEQGVYLMSALSPRDCVSLYGRFGIEGASVSSLQRLAADAGRLWSGCADDALAAMRAGEAIPARAVSVCISLDGTMLPMILDRVAETNPATNPIARLPPAPCLRPCATFRRMPLQR